MTCLGDTTTTPLLAAPDARNVAINIGDGTAPTKLTVSAVSVTDSSTITLRGATYPDPGYIRAGTGEGNKIILAASSTDWIYVDGNRNEIGLSGSRVSGIDARGIDNRIAVTDSSVSSGAFGSVTAIGAVGSDNRIALDRTSVEAGSSRGASGVYVAGDRNVITLNASSVKTGGARAAGGIDVYGDSNTVLLTRTTIHVGFDGSFGPIYSYRGVGVNGRGKSITVDATSHIIASGIGMTVTGDNNQIVNRGTIDSYTGIKQYSGRGNIFVNSGSITGYGTAVSLAPGGNRLIVQTGSVVNGNIGGGGDSIMTLQGSGSLTSAVSGFQTLTMEGPSAWVLSGNTTFTGGTTVTGGTLVANGTLASPVTINAGGTLAGTGTVGSVTTNAGSTLAPGNPGGVLTVDGSVTLNPGSRFQVAVAPAGSKSCLYASGTASVGGASVQVLADPGSYPLNTRYTILSAGGGVVGTFGDLSTSVTAPFLVPRLLYDPNNVFFTVGTDFVSAAITPNQRAVAGYLDRVSGDPGMQPLVGRLLGLSALQAPAAFTSLDGELHASLSTAMLNQGSQALRRLGGRLAMLEGGVPAAALAWSGLKVVGAAPTTSDMPTPYAQSAGPAGLGFTGPGFWIQGVGDFSNVDGDPNAAGYRYRSGGVATGVDAQIASGTLCGGELQLSLGLVECGRA